MATIVTAIVVFIAVITMLILLGFSTSYSWRRRKPIIGTVKSRADTPLFIPYTKNSSFEHGLYVNASINGGPVGKFRVDTGSVGIVVGANEIGSNIPLERNTATGDGIDVIGATEATEPGQITYTSSGVQLDGEWRDSIVTFVDAVDHNGKPLQVRVDVLVATDRRVLPGRVNPPDAHLSVVGKSNNHATTAPRVFMMGIGFGRGQNGNNASFSEKRNPLLNIGVKSSQKGYILDRRGIQLDWTSTDRFTKQQLDPIIANDSIVDWKTLTGTIQLGADGVVTQSTILIDTGLTNMMIGIPDLPHMRPVANDTQITVGLLNGRVPYSFVVGDRSNPMTPSKVTLIKPRSSTHSLNTGLHVLTGYDYLYDAREGVVGLRPARHFF